jgi:phage gpG-like protein
LDSLLIDWSTHKSGPHLASSFEIQYGPGEVEVGTDVPYANTHQYGRGRIPARPFLGIGPQDEPGIESAISDAFFEMQARAMGARG